MKLLNYIALLFGTIITILSTVIVVIGYQDLATKLSVYEALAFILLGFVTGITLIKVSISNIVKLHN